jgi:hypothetical protein
MEILTPERELLIHSLKNLTMLPIAMPWLWYIDVWEIAPKHWKLISRLLHYLPTMI